MSERTQLARRLVIAGDSRYCSADEKADLRTAADIIEKLDTSDIGERMPVSNAIRRAETIMQLVREFAKTTNHDEAEPAYNALFCAVVALEADAIEWQARALALFWRGHADDVTVQKIREATAAIEAVLRDGEVRSTTKRG